MIYRLYCLTLVTLLWIGLWQCKPAPSRPDLPTLPERSLYLLTSGNQLIETNLNKLASQTTQAISGLTDGEMLLAIDFRPATGQLYALSNQNRLYTINLNTMVANLIIRLSPALAQGTTTEFDFDPTLDQIRVMTDSGQNYRVDPISGTVTHNGAILNQAERDKALNQLTDEEKLDKVGLEKLVSDYLFTEREPLNDDIVGILKEKPKLLQRKSIVERIKDKILDFVDTFINGLPGVEE